MRRVMVLTLITGILPLAVSPTVAGASHVTADCRDEPSETTEQNLTVDLSGSEVAFVGADAEYGPTGTGILVCAGVMGVDTNAGVVEDPVRGLVPVLNCSSARPVTSADCYLDTGGAVVFIGDVHTTPALDVTPGVHTHQVTGTLSRVGVIDSLVTVLGSVPCSATVNTVVTENAAAGVTSGSWNCTDGRGGGMLSTRAGTEAAIAVTGDLTGVLECSLAAQSAPPVSDAAIVCVGSGAGY